MGYEPALDAVEGVNWSLGHDALEALNDAQEGEEAKRADAASLARTRLQGLLTGLPFSDEEPTAKASREALAACAKTDAAQAKQRLVPLYEVGGALAGKLLPVEGPRDMEDCWPPTAEAKKQLEDAEAMKKRRDRAARRAEGPDGARPDGHTSCICAFGQGIAVHL